MGDPIFIQNKSYIEGSQPEWCISSMMYSGDTPIWSETLEYYVNLHDRMSRSALPTVLC